MPTGRGGWPGKSKIARKHLSELTCPTADRLIANINATLRQQFLDVAKAQGEPKVQPNGVADYVCGIPMASVGDWIHGLPDPKAMGRQPSSPSTQSFPPSGRVNMTIPPGDLEASIAAFVERYNHHRYHESLGNLTPADVYLGRDRTIIERRRKIKNQTFEKRRLAHQRLAA